MLALAFVAEGVDTFRNPQARTGGTGAIGSGVKDEETPDRSEQIERLVRLNGALQVGAGLLLTVGRFRRLAAAALIVSIVPTTYAGRRFWDETDAPTRAEQQHLLVKNVGLAGGLILAMVDSEGAPSMAWRTRRRVSRIAAGATAGHALADGHDGRVGTAPSEKASQLAGDVGDAALHLARQAAGSLLAAGRQAGGTALAAAADPDGAAHRAVRTGVDTLVPVLAAGAEHAGDLLGRVHDRLPG
jgi:uncharacterized membrane protein YphA (DoxX/SURF4 family)